MAPQSGNKQTVRVGRDAETMADLERQHEVMDTEVRSTDGIDYDQVRREARELIRKRKEGMNSVQLRTFALNNYPYFCNKFPQFLLAIVKDCESHRLDEFSSIMESLIAGLEKVQRGNLSQTELRKSLFEAELATKYFRPK